MSISTRSLNLPELIQHLIFQKWQLRDSTWCVEKEISKLNRILKMNTNVVICVRYLQSSSSLYCVIAWILKHWMSMLHTFLLIGYEINTPHQLVSIMNAFDWIVILSIFRSILQSHYEREIVGRISRKWDYCYKLRGRVNVYVYIYV